MTDIVSLVYWFIDLSSHWLIGLLVTFPGVQAMFRNIGPSTWKPFLGTLSGTRIGNSTTVLNAPMGGNGGK